MPGRLSQSARLHPALLVLSAAVALMPAGAAAQSRAVDPRAVALLAQVVARASRVTAFHAEQLTEAKYPGATVPNKETLKLRFRKPGQSWYERWNVEALIERDSKGEEKVVLGPFEQQWLQVNDGRFFTSGHHKSFQAFAASRVGEPYAGGLIGIFVAPNDPRIDDASWSSAHLTARGLIGLQLMGTEKWRGTTYQVVTWTYRNRFLAPEDDYINVTKLYVGADSIIHRAVTTSTKGVVIDQWLGSLVLDPPQTADEFVAKLPAGAKVDTAPRATPGTWLTAGKSAPDFTVALAGTSQTFTLSKATAAKRAVAIFTWFYG